jgi:hypothetical protein
VFTIRINCAVEVSNTAANAGAVQAAASKRQLAEALWRASSALVGEDDSNDAGGLVQ